MYIIMNYRASREGILSSLDYLVTNVAMTKITLFILRAKSLVCDEITKNRKRISVMLQYQNDIKEINVSRLIKAGHDVIHE
jgi:hypothetical protein